MAPRGKELADTLPRVVDIFSKHGEVLFPEEPRPYIEPKDPIELLKEKLNNKKKKKKEKKQEEEID